MSILVLIIFRELNINLYNIINDDKYDNLYLYGKQILIKGYNSDSQILGLLNEHLHFLVNDYKNPSSYQALMVLVFSLQKHLPAESVTNLVTSIGNFIQKDGISSGLKTYLFIMLEFIFSQREFNKQVLKTIVKCMFNTEELLADQLSNQAYVISFLRAFLQILLNFYSSFALEAKPYIPAFLGVLLELFADKGPSELDFDDPEFALEESMEVGEDGLISKELAPTQVPEDRKGDKSSLASLNNYSLLAENIFSMLTEFSFDKNLFSDMSSNSSEELTDIFANFDFRRDVVGQNNSGPGSTSSKIFALISYALSDRFKKSRSFICKVLKDMIQKIGSLDLQFSQKFHMSISRMAVNILAFGSSLKEADALQGQILELVDLNCLFDILKSEVLLDIENISVLEREDFTHMLYVFSRYTKSLDFTFFAEKIFPLLEHMATKDRSQMSQFEEMLFKKLYSSVTGFRNFQGLYSLPDSQIEESVKIIVESLLPLSDEIVDLNNSFLSLFQGFLLSLFESKDKSPRVVNAIIQLLQTSNVLGKFCGKIAKADRVLLEENCLQLIVKLFPRQYISEVFQKNCSRLSEGLKLKNKIEKSLKEGVILCFICKASGELSRDDSIYRNLLNFCGQLLALDRQSQSKESNLFSMRVSDKRKCILRANCLVLQILTFLVPNVPWSLYPEIVQMAKQTIRSSNIGTTQKEQPKSNSQSLDIEEGIMPKTSWNNKQTISVNKYDQQALRFSLQLMLSADLNIIATRAISEGDQLQMAQTKQKVLMALAEFFLPLAMVNIKSRNKKTRIYAKQVLKQLVDLEHPKNDLVRESIKVNSLSVSSVIAGLAGKTSYLKSSAIQALGYLYKGFHGAFNLDLKQSLLEVVLLLTNEHNKEIFHSVLKFLKTYVKLENADAIRSNKEGIRCSIFSEDEKLGVGFRAKVKGIIMILMRKLGKEEIREMVGDKWANMIRYVAKKISNLKKPSKFTRQLENELEGEKEKDETLPEEDFDVKGFLKERRQLVAKRKKLANNTFNGFVGEIFRKYLAGSLKETPNQEKIEEEEKETVDPNESNEIRDFIQDKQLKEFFQEGVKHKIKAGDERKERSKKKGDVYFDEKTGKLVIKQKPIERTLTGKRNFSDFETENPSESKSTTIGNLKRKRPRSFQSKQSRELSEAKYKKIIEGVTRKRKHVNEAVHSIHETGKSFKNKSGGDSAFKNRLSPHAFVQFNPVAISKKLRHKAKKAFEMVVTKRKKTSGVLKNLKIKS